MTLSIIVLRVEDNDDAEEMSEKIFCWRLSLHGTVLELTSEVKIESSVISRDKLDAVESSDDSEAFEESRIEFVISFVDAFRRPISLKCLSALLISASNF